MLTKRSQDSHSSERVTQHRPASTLEGRGPLIVKSSEINAQWKRSTYYDTPPCSVPMATMSTPPPRMTHATVEVHHVFHELLT